MYQTEQIIGNNNPQQKQKSTTAANHKLLHLPQQQIKKRDYRATAVGRKEASISDKTQTNKQTSNNQRLQKSITDKSLARQPKQSTTRTDEQTRKRHE